MACSKCQQLAQQQTWHKPEPACCGQCKEIRNCIDDLYIQEQINVIPPLDFFFLQDRVWLQIAPDTQGSILMTYPNPYYNETQVASEKNSPMSVGWVTPNRGWTVTDLGLELNLGEGLSFNDDGQLTATGADFQVDNTYSVSLEIVGSTLTGNVNLSELTGNALTIEPDGLYAPEIEILGGENTIVSKVKDTYTISTKKQVQADWEETDKNSLAYIHNKPEIPEMPTYATVTKAGLVRPDGVTIVLGPDGLISSRSGGGTVSTDHAALQNLDYASSGHTGFASSDDVDTLTAKVGEVEEEIATATDTAEQAAATAAEAKTMAANAIQEETDPVFMAWDKSYNDLTDTPTLGTAAALNVGTEVGNIPTISPSGKILASTLPLATTSSIGAVQPDGETITVENGIISSQAAAVYTAGENIAISDDNVISATSYDDSEIKTELAKKQNTLTAGENITINGSTISATNTVYDDTAVRALIATKQNTLTAGDLIDITNDTISVDLTGVNTYLPAVEPTGVVDGVNKVFTLSDAPTDSSAVMVYRDGQLLTLDGDYTLSGNTLTFLNAPQVNSVLRVYYSTVAAASGNADTLDNKHASDFQEKLVAGENIEITNNTISTNLSAVQQAISDLNAAVEALGGATRYIGNINEETANITQAKLTARANELGYTTLQAGYALVDADNVTWIYNGSEWVQIGSSQVATATNTSLGVVKGSSEDLKISVAADGTMSVVNLATKLSAKQNTLTAGSNIAISGDTISATDTVYDDTELRNLVNDKQNKLVAGDNISIEGDTISATASAYDDTEIRGLINEKQDALTAGDNITISGNTISAVNTTYQAATTSALGLVKPDGTTITVNNGTISAASGSGTVTSVAISDNGGLSVSGSPITTNGTIRIGHSNSVTAQTSQKIYPITIDQYGHITSYGSAVSIPSVRSERMAMVNIDGNNAVINLGHGKNFMIKQDQFTSDITVKVERDGSQATSNMMTFTLFIPQPSSTHNITFKMRDSKNDSVVWMSSQPGYSANKKTSITFVPNNSDSYGDDDNIEWYAYWNGTES